VRVVYKFAVTAHGRPCFGKSFLTALTEDTFYTNLRRTRLVFLFEGEQKFSHKHLYK